MNALEELKNIMLLNGINGDTTLQTIESFKQWLDNNNLIFADRTETIIEEEKEKIEFHMPPAPSYWK